MGLNKSAVPFTLRFCVSLASPPSAVYLISRAIILVYGISINRWLLALASIISIPATFFATVLWLSLQDHRNAAAMNARLPPSLCGKLPGNYDILQALLKELYNGYPGELSNTPLIDNTQRLFYRWNIQSVSKICRRCLQPPYLVGKRCFHNGARAYKGTPYVICDVMHELTACRPYSQPISTTSKRVHYSFASCNLF